VKKKTRAMACIFCIVMVVMVVPGVSAASIPVIIPAGSEVDVNQWLAAGERVQISVSVDGGYFMSFFFMNSTQFNAWKSNSSYAKLNGWWIYNEPAASQEDRIYEVPVNDTYYLVFLNTNGDNITVNYDFLIVLPPTINGNPAMLILCLIVIIIAVLSYWVARRLRLEGDERNA